MPNQEAGLRVPSPVEGEGEGVAEREVETVTVLDAEGAVDGNEGSFGQPRVSSVSESQ